jgi:hypothetical protein
MENDLCLAAFIACWMVNVLVVRLFVKNVRFQTAS